MSDKVATGTAYASSFVTVLTASFSFNEMLAFGGFVIGAITMFYNIWFKERVLRDERAYKRALLDEIKQKEVVNVAQDINDVAK